jgi:tetratricopeptide (TPR) repeat protein
VDDLTAPRSEPIEAISDAIQRSVIERELSAALQHPLPTLSSYSLFLAAISLMHRASRVEFERSRDMLDHLVDRHRRVPAPRAWLAQWYVLRMTRGWSAGPSADAAEALEQTRRAIDIDPSCSLAYTMAGFVQCHLRKDLDSAGALYQQALDANPNESLAWLFVSVLHTFKGEGEAALAASERALSLSPLDPLRYYYHSLAASAAVAAGRYERAIELARRAIKSNRTHTSTYRALAMAQALSGREAEARITAAQLLALEPSFTVGRFLERSPSAQTGAGALYAAALRAAGVPE